MAIDRRAFLLGCTCGTLALPEPGEARERDQVLYAAARRHADGSYSAAVFASDGRDVRVVMLPDRGHDVSVCPVTRRCVVFARRPGNFAIAFSADRSAPPIAFTTPPDRHFYGHGVFSRDGRLLYATENDFEAGRGVIGIYDATDAFRRIGEFASHGVGPHDLALLRGQPVLVVANGGLREHPDFGNGRRVLNPGAIETSLAYIDTRSGDLLERHDVGAPGTLSLRHLDIGRNDTVVLGAQIEGHTDKVRSLVFSHRRQQRLAAMDLPVTLARRLDGYISSVAVDASGDVAAVTSSRGALSLMIEIATGRVIGNAMLDDVSGVAPTGSPGRFLLTSGSGVMIEAAATTASTPVRTTAAWDNHTVALGMP